MKYLNLARFKPLFTRSPLVLQQANSRVFSTVPEADKSKILKSPYPDVQIPKKSLYFLVAENFAKHGAKTALIDGTTGKKTSYNELEEMIAKVGSALLRMGVQRNDVVSLISPNSAEFAVQFFASSAVGAVVHPVNPVYTSGEIAYQLKDCGAKYIATVSSILSTVKEAASQVGVPNDKIIVLDTDGHGEHISFNKLLEDSGSSFPDGGVPVDPDEMACLLYSSGTTGLPKGVMLSHYNIVANICQLDHPQLLDVRTPASCLLGVLPFYHIYAMTVILALGLHQGSSILSLPKFEPQPFLSSLERFAVTNAFVAPPLAVFMTKSPLVSQYNLSSLREIFSAAAPLGLDLAKAVKDRIGVKVVRQGYGLTECSPLSHCCPIGIDKPNSLGGPVLNTEICIVDTESRQVLGPNECGELLIRGPQVMLGYLNRPEATASSVTDDRWFYSGDICYYDNDGHFYIVDRLKELIKVKGFQVAPAELEGVLLTHPQVADCAVVGVSDERSGEVPKAFVVRKSPDVSEKDLDRFVSSKVSAHKHLKGGVVFVDSIPKSNTGKILRRQLREMS